MAIDKNNIKNKFRAEEKLPDEFAWQNMESGILEKMNRTNKYLSPRSIFKKYFALLIAFAICGFGFYIFTHIEQKSGVAIVEDKAVKEPAQNEEKKSMKSSVVEKAMIENTSYNASVSNSTNSNSIGIENNEEYNTASKDKFLNQSVGIQKSSDREKIAKITTFEKPIAVIEPNKVERNMPNKSSASIQSKDSKNTGMQSSEQVLSNDVDDKETKEVINQSLLANNSENPKIVKETNEVIAESKIDQSNNSNLIDNITSIENQRMAFEISELTAPFKSLLSQSSNHNVAYLAIIQPPKLIRQLARSTNSIYIYSGVNRGHTFFGNDAIEKSKSKYEKDTLGYSIGIGWIKKLNNKFSLDIGLQYNKINSILDYKSQSLRYEILKSNAILGININAITGEKDTIVGEGIERGSKTRTVYWHNVHKNWMVPVVVNYHKSIGRFDVSAGLGLQVSYTSHYAGKTIAAMDSIIVTNNDYVAKWAYGTIVQIGAGYALGSNMIIGARSSTMVPFTRLTVSPTSAINRYVWNGGIYIAYQF